MISVQRFAQGGRPVFALILILLLIAPACSNRDTARPQIEQHLRLAGSIHGIQTIDPALVRDVESAFIARQIFRGLVKLDSNLGPVPDLAQTVEVLNDGMLVRFTLRDGLTFHDGKPIDAIAVQRTFNRAADPALTGGSGAGLPAATYFNDIAGIDERLAGTADNISGINVVDALTIEFALRRPSASFLMKMTGSPAAVVDVDSSSASGWWQRANGSGPFRIDSYTPAEKLELVAFDGFAAGRPRLDRVTFLFGVGAAQPLNSYELGRIDVTSVPGWAVDRVQSPASPLADQLVVTEMLSTTFIAFNFNIEPYGNPDTRAMIASGIEVERIVNLSLNGRAAMAAGMIPPGISGRTWQSRTAAFDLDAAAGFRDDAGSGSAPVIVEPGAGVSSIASYVLKRDLGVDLVVIDQPWPAFSEQLSARALPAFVVTWVADYPDPENTLAALLRTGSPDNYTGYSNPWFDALVERAATEPNPETRALLYLEAQQLVLDDVAVIPLYHGMSYTLVQPWVRGLEITEIGILGLEDVWIGSE